MVAFPDHRKMQLKDAYNILNMLHKVKQQKKENKKYLLDNISHIFIMYVV